MELVFFVHRKIMLFNERLESPFPGLIDNTYHGSYAHRQKILDASTPANMSKIVLPKQCSRKNKIRQCS
jgi:hypothetical protein